MLGLRSPMFATRQARIGAAGSVRQIGAWCPLPRSVNGKIPDLGKPRLGSPWTKVDHCSLLPASGRLGMEREDRNRTR